MMHEAHRIEATIAARFLVGRDCHGTWVVRDRLGRVGGLFANESAALHFAAEEAGHDPRQVRRIPEGTLPDLHADFAKTSRRGPIPVDK